MDSSFSSAELIPAFCLYHVSKILALSGWFLAATPASTAATHLALGPRSALIMTVSGCAALHDSESARVSGQRKFDDL